MKEMGLIDARWMRAAARFVLGLMFASHASDGEMGEIFVCCFVKGERFYIACG
jgi:hypothetical protein